MHAPNEYILPQFDKFSTEIKFIPIIKHEL